MVNSTMMNQQTVRVTRSHNSNTQHTVNTAYSSIHYDSVQNRMLHISIRRNSNTAKHGIQSNMAANTINTSSIVQHDIEKVKFWSVGNLVRSVYKRLTPKAAWGPGNDRYVIEEIRRYK